MNFYTVFAVFFNRFGPNGKGVAIISIQYLGQSLRVQLVRADSEIDVLFSILKALSFPLARGIKLHIRTLDLIPCLIPCHCSEKSAR